MSDMVLRKELSSLDVQACIREQHAHGRSGLSDEFLQFWAREHRRAVAILTDPPRGHVVRRLARVLEVATRSIANLAVNRKPRYYTYTDVHVLDWYLGSLRAPFRELRTRSVRGILLLLRDLVRFEAESIAGIEKHHTEKFDQDNINKRIQLVRAAFVGAEELYVGLGGSLSEINYDTTHFPKLDGYAEDPGLGSGVVHFTCFPQTSFHDEVVFLRTIHVSEFCFLGLRMSFVEATENPANDQVQTEALRDALGFASILHRMFKVLRTMPPERFKDFRDATGDASAVQSRNYQLMDIHFRGLDSRKRAHLQEDPLLNDLALFQHKQFIHLGNIVRNSATASPSVVAIAKALDTQLLSWRGLHLAFAKAYLDPAQPGTGATVGAAYLEQFLKSGLFEDTPFDLAAIDDLFGDLPEIPLMFRRVSPAIGISPERPTSTE